MVEEAEERVLDDIFHLKAKRLYIIQVNEFRRIWTSKCFLDNILVRYGAAAAEVLIH
jgi:hypothetical protein